MNAALGVTNQKGDNFRVSTNVKAEKELTAKCWYTCAVYDWLGGECSTVCPLSSYCRWSGPHTCLCIQPHSCTTALSLTSHHVSTAFLHHRYSPPLRLHDVEPAGLHWVITDQNTHSLIRVLGRQRWLPPPGLLSMQGRSANRCSWCRPFPRLLHVLLGFSCCFHVHWAPAYSCITRPPSVTLSGSTGGQENTTNRRISPKQMSWESPCSHPTII